MYLNTQIYTTLLFILIDVNFNYGKDLFQYLQLGPDYELFFCYL
jgi:hypothetical protein